LINQNYQNYHGNLSPPPKERNTPEQEKPRIEKLPNLPKGWTAHWDRNSEKYYFVQNSTGTSQWGIPLHSRSPSPPRGKWEKGMRIAPPKCPKGWKTKWNSRFKSHYFVEISTGHEQWEYPSHADSKSYKAQATQSPTVVAVENKYHSNSSPSWGLGGAGNYDWNCHSTSSLPPTYTSVVDSSYSNELPYTSVIDSSYSNELLHQEIPHISPANMTYMTSMPISLELASHDSYSTHTFESGFKPWSSKGTGKSNIGYNDELRIQRRQRRAN
jgi:hypothetical protein